jgi:hypothetical protein
MLRFPALSPKSSAWLLAGCLGAVVATTFALRFLDWGSGVWRGLILFEMLTGVVLMGSPTRESIVGPRLNLLVHVLLAAATAFWLVSAAETIAKTARTGAIPLDQGQTTMRAARLLLRGENPYGFGALVDFQTFYDRLPAREAAGLGPAVDRNGLRPALDAYDVDLAETEKTKLLPPAPSAGPAALEAHLLGYKYGALFPVVALPFAALRAPAGIMALNAFVTALTLAVLYALMRRRADPRLARLGLLGLLCDNTILVNYVEHSATDIFALLFCALAVLAFQRGRENLAATALAVGFGFKIFPCALLFPLLLKDRRLRPSFVFAGVAAAIYLPFAVSDPWGLLHNVFLWPLHLATDSTSWLYFAAPAVGAVARAAGLAGIVWAWARFWLGREPSLYRTLAEVALLALSTNGASHNNYVPWASIWIVVALVERFGPPFEPAPARAAQALEPRLAPA